MKKLIILGVITIYTFLPIQTYALNFPDSTISWLGANVGKSVATTAFTIMAWAYRTDTSTNSGVIWMAAPLGANGEYFCRFQNNTALRISVNTGTATTFTSPAFASVNNRWVHVACVWDGALMYLYLNGVSQGTPVAKTGTLAAPTYYRIGQSLVGGAFAFKGDLADLRVYNRALLPSEIKNYYHLNRVSRVGLIHHYPLRSFSLASTTIDIAGQGTFATSTGTTTVGRLPPMRR